MSSSSEDEGDDLCEYEKQRLKRIEENKRKLSEIMGTNSSLLPQCKVKITLFLKCVNTYIHNSIREVRQCSHQVTRSENLLL